MLGIIALILSIFSLALAIYNAKTPKIIRTNDVSAIRSATNGIWRGNPVRIKLTNDVLSFDAVFIERQGDTVILTIEDFEKVINIHDIEYIYKLNK